MSEFATGMLVKHASLGVGRVVAVEPTAVHVFFPESKKRYAAKLRWPGAKTFLTADGVAPDAWLEGLSSFALDAESGRYALAASWITHEEAVAEFLAAYPKGFAEPVHAGSGGRAARWRQAGEEWARAFGGGEGERLLAAGDIRELVQRAQRVGRHVSLVPGALSASDLAGALANLDAAPAFFEALLGVVSVPSPARARFEKLFAAVAALGVTPALAWPVATVFPFVASPAKQVFLSPKATCAAAERLGCDLRFDPAPNWATYAALRALAEGLRNRLQAIGARDLVDFEVFLHATATRRASAPVKRKR